METNSKRNGFYKGGRKKWAWKDPKADSNHFEACKKWFVINKGFNCYEHMGYDCGKGKSGSINVYRYWKDDPSGR